jgi:GWxTD domain-containing protein
MRAKLLVVMLLMLQAGIAEAGLSKAAQDWRRGPEKFLISDEEGKAWKALKSDADAAAFIDLFWARRDPTSGTPRNEFREEFLTRVRYADSAFAEKRNRGALTERGQAYILLGPPESGTRATMSMAGHSGMSAASARTGDNMVWTWSREKAVELGVPKLTAAFNQIVGTDMYARDTKFGQFSNVSAVAIKKNILHPEMTAVPDWAARVSNEVFAGAPAPAPKPDAKPIGHIGRLIVLGDLGALDLDADRDPLATLQPVKEFLVDADLAWVLEYCGASGTLKIEAKIADVATASELEPVSMRAVAGCGAIPGMLSLSGLEPGPYDLEITVIEANGARLMTKQRVQIR